MVRLERALYSVLAVGVNLMDMDFERCWTDTDGDGDGEGEQSLDTPNGEGRSEAHVRHVRHHVECGVRCSTKTLYRVRLLTFFTALVIL